MTRKGISRANKFAKYTFWMAGMVAVRFLQAAHADTPEQFVRSFADFKFAYHETIQEPDVFLSTKSGDCDDFATLAVAILGARGYATRLVTVRMKGENHVVCYVPATGSYLDYNNRADANPLVPSDGSLRDIANKVARSFGRDWLSVYEFSYREKMKWLVNTVLFNQPAEEQSLASN